MTSATPIPASLQIDTAASAGRAALDSVAPSPEQYARVRRALQESEAQFRTLLETVRSAAVIIDAQGTVTFANDALLAVTGWPREEVIESNWFEQFAPGGDAARRRFTELLARGDVPAHSTHEIVTRDGGRRLIAWDSTLLRDGAGTPIGVVSVGQDVTEQRAFETRLALLAEYDELTGLLNRRGFRRMAAHAMKSAPRTARRDAIVRVAFDGLDAIREAHGEADRDDALCTVAALLQRTIRGSDVAGRLGEDEFAIHAVGLRHGGDAEILATRIEAALASHNRDALAAGRPYVIALNVGFAEIEFGDDVDQTLAVAAASLTERRMTRGSGYEE